VHQQNDTRHSRDQILGLGYNVPQSFAYEAALVVSFCSSSATLFGTPQSQQFYSSLTLTCHRRDILVK